MAQPTLGGATPPNLRPVPPPQGANKGSRGNGTTTPVPPPGGKADPKQAAAPDPKPQEVKKVKAVADKAAIALAIGGVEEQLIEWWPLLEQHIINTHGQQGGTVTLKIAIEPDAEMGLRARVGSTFSGSSLKRTWKAQIRKGKGKDDKAQLELFTA